MPSVKVQIPLRQSTTTKNILAATSLAYTQVPQLHILPQLHRQTILPPAQSPTLRVQRASLRAMASAASVSNAKPSNFFGFTTKSSTGDAYPLSQHQGKVVLVVNTASKCGFTPQYGNLEALNAKIADPENFVILGFPCNQFGNQDPDSDEKIQDFCSLNYKVNFPVLKKTEVNGDNAEPVWEWMKSEKPGVMGLKRVKWNFEKFLIGRDGKVVNRWASLTNPASLEADVRRELAKPKPTVKSEL